MAFSGKKEKARLVHPDRGAVGVEKAAAIALSATIVGALVSVGIPGVVGSNTKAAVCKIFQGDDCGTPEDGKDGKLGAAPGVSASHTALAMKQVDNEKSPSPEPTPQDKGFSVEELLGDCEHPGVVVDEMSALNYHGTGYRAFLDGCTFEEQESWQDWRWEDIGSAAVSNCRTSGATPYPSQANSGLIDQTISGSKTHTQGFSIGGVPRPGTGPRAPRRAR